MFRNALYIGILCSIPLVAPAYEQDPQPDLPAQMSVAELEGALFSQARVTCFKQGETIDGMNKICFYDCLGSAAAITIRATQLCPLTIRQ